MRQWKLIVIVMFLLIVVVLIARQKTGESIKVNPKSIESKITNGQPLINHESAIIYEYVDESGNLVITNKHKVKARKMKLAPLVIYASPMTKNDLYTDGDTVNLPKSDLKTSPIHNWDKSIPNINETSRNFVLSEELTHEKEAFNSAQTLLTNARAGKLITEDNTQYKNRLQMLQDNVEEHKKNIELLTSILDK